MTTITFEWTIEHLEKLNDKGQKMARVLEHYRGADVDPREFMVPSVVAENLVIARREFTRRVMSERGHIKLLLQ